MNARKGKKQAERQRTALRERTLAELEAIAFADLGDYIRMEEGRPVVVDFGALPAEKRKALALVKEGTRGVEVRLYDKMKALEMLMKAGGAMGRGRREAGGGGAGGVGRGHRAGYAAVFEQMM